MTSLNKYHELFQEHLAILPSASIDHFHRKHNAPRLPPNSNHCLQLLLYITVVSREIEDNGYAKLGGGGEVNKVDNDEWPEAYAITLDIR